MNELEEQTRRYFDQDRHAAALGIELVQVSLGHAHARMLIREDHYNGLRTVHGGALFTLADFAFAVAANSHGTIAVGVNTSMSFVKAATTGTLYAEAREMSRSPKLSTYEVVITDDSCATIAIFQGMVYNKREKISDYIKGI